MGKSLGSWGWIAHAKVYSHPPLLIFPDLLKSNDQIIIYPFKMDQMVANTMFRPIHQGTFHDKLVD